MNLKYDLVVYGGTSAGVVAAQQAARSGCRVALVCPENHLGGLSSGGLGWTDSGNTACIGGLALEFYQRVYEKYQHGDAWRWQTRESFDARGQGTPAMREDTKSMWIFEPHVAEEVFEDIVREARIPVFRDCRLDRDRGVRVRNRRIRSIAMLNGTSFSADYWIDATYEGDLMAAAGVEYHVGREANSEFDEEWNGVQKATFHHEHTFEHPIDPYVVPGDPSSGLLPLISDEAPGADGTADDRVQAYCFRLCMSCHPDNRIPFPKPQGYRRETYALLERLFEAGWRDVFGKFDAVPNLKTDTNNHGPFSSDHIGANHAYPDASYAEREVLIEDHVRYQQGLLYFLQNDEALPREIRAEMARWGLPRDEFSDNGNWPHQLYIREARRMRGAYVMTERNLKLQRETPVPVGMGSYTLDAHNALRYVTPEGKVQNDGDVGVKLKSPYPVAYSSLLPRKEQCENLVVPVCLSCTHIAFGSIRMEPVFMILGHSAATAAVLALRDGCALQEVDPDELTGRLQHEGQILET